MRSNLHPLDGKLYADWIRPVRDYIVVELEPGALKTESGLLLPDLSKKAGRLIIGTILDSGPEAEEVSVGDRVILSPYANDTFEWAGREEHDIDTGARRPLTYTLCRAEAVQAVIPS